MRIPYHPLTHQSLDLPDKNEELTKEEAEEFVNIFRFLLSRVLLFSGVIVVSFLLTFFIFR